MKLTILGAGTCMLSPIRSCSGYWVEASRLRPCTAGIFSGDTAWSPHLVGFFGDVDLLVAECSYIELPSGSRHLDPKQTAMLAHEAGARRLVATHFHFDPDTERLAAGYSGAIAVAGDGLTIE